MSAAAKMAALRRKAAVAATASKTTTKEQEGAGVCLEDYVAAQARQARQQLARLDKEVHEEDLRQHNEDALAAVDAQRDAEARRKARGHMPPMPTAANFRALGANAMHGLLLLAQIGATGLSPEQLEYQKRSKRISARINAASNTLATDLAGRCAGGCANTAHVNVVRFLSNPKACDATVCNVGCAQLIAHNACLDEMLSKSPNPVVSIPCADCGGTISRRRIPVASAKGVWTIAKRTLIWVWSNLFFWPFVCFFAGLFTMWLGALIEHYDAPQKVPHPGTLFFDKFEYHPKDSDIIFESYNWFHRWMLALASYLFFGGVMLAWTSFWLFVRLVRYAASRMGEMLPTRTMYMTE